MKATKYPKLLPKYLDKELKKKIKEFNSESKGINTKEEYDLLATKIFGDVEKHWELYGVAQRYWQKVVLLLFQSAMILFSIVSEITILIIFYNKI